MLYFLASRRHLTRGCPARHGVKRGGLDRDFMVVAVMPGVAVATNVRGTGAPMNLNDWAGIGGGEVPMGAAACPEIPCLRVTAGERGDPVSGMAG